MARPSVPDPPFIRAAMRWLAAAPKRSPAILMALIAAFFALCFAIPGWRAREIGLDTFRSDLAGFLAEIAVVLLVIEFALEAHRRAQWADARERCSKVLDECRYTIESMSRTLSNRVAALVGGSEVFHPAAGQKLPVPLHDLLNYGAGALEEFARNPEFEANRTRLEALAGIAASNPEIGHEYSGVVILYTGAIAARSHAEKAVTAYQFGDMPRVADAARTTAQFLSRAHHCGQEFGDIDEPVIKNHLELAAYAVHRLADEMNVALKRKRERVATKKPKLKF